MVGAHFPPRPQADDRTAAPAEQTNDVPAGEVWSGIPSRPSAEQRRIWAGQTHLPELLKRVRALEKRVRELEEGQV